MPSLASNCFDPWPGLSTLRVQAEASLASQCLAFAVVLCSFLGSLNLVMGESAWCEASAWGLASWP